MPTDVNDKIKMWGGFTPGEFGIGAAVLACAFFACVIGISVWAHHFKVGIGAFFGISGPWAMFMLYKRDLPEGYLLRRWKQEGRFLIFHLPSLKGTDLFLPPSERRGEQFDRAWEDGNV